MILTVSAPPSDQRPFRVVIVKQSGVRVAFQGYATLKEAELVRDRLRAWQCQCDVEGPDAPGAPAEQKS